MGPRPERAARAERAGCGYPPVERVAGPLDGVGTSPESWPDSVIATASNPARLLRVEHAVAAALTADAPLDVLLAEIAAGLGWHYGGAWLPQAGAGPLRRHLGRA